MKKYSDVDSAESAMVKFMWVVTAIVLFTIAIPVVINIFDGHLDISSPRPFLRVEASSKVCTLPAPDATEPLICEGE